jgi:hypothetical protein
MAEHRVRSILLAVLSLAAAAMALLGWGTSILAGLGPAATALIWLPPALWLASTTMEVARPGVAWTLRLVARASLWLLLALALVDPAPNLPDTIGIGLSGVIGSAASAIRTAVLGVVGLMIAGWVAAAFLGSGSGTTTPTERTERTTGSTIHPLVALLLRIVARLGARLLVLVIGSLFLAVAWTLDGRDGVRAVRGSEDTPARVGSSLRRFRGGLLAVITRGSGLLGRATADWGRRSTTGVWSQPASLARDEEGALSVRPWPREQLVTAEDEELEELAAILQAMDVALMTGAGAQRPQGAPGHPQQAARVHPYELRIERAWSRPGYHALVVTAEPAAAGAAMARVTASQLAAALDPLTRWTADELTTMLRLSDRRVATDPLREGATGLFVGVDRPSAVDEPEPVADVPVEPLRRAVDRALAEVGLDRRFRFHGMEETEDGSTVVEYRASFGPSSEYLDLQSRWVGLESAVTIHARTTVKLSTRLDPYGFIATLPAPPGQGWPSGEATDWRRVVETIPVSVGHPSRVVLGLDRRANPVTLELAGETSHLLVGSATGGGKTTLVQSVLASLLWADLRIAERLGDRWPPLELVLVESTKREMASRFGGVAVQVVDGTDGDEVVAAVEGYRAEMERRYRVLDGRPYDPRTMPRRILLLEEFASLRLSLDRAQDERMVRALTVAANTGRAAACGLILTVQKATVGTVPPAAKASLTRIAGWYPQASDLGVVLDHPKRGLLPRVPGRMAMQAADEISVFQALHVTDEQIRAVVRDWQRVFRTAPTDPLRATPRPTPAGPVTAQDLARLDAAVVARILLHWQQTSATPITVSVRGVIAHVRDDLGLVPGRVEGWTDALAELERIGVLAPIADHATSARRLTVDDWSGVERLLRAAGHAN